MKSFSLPAPAKLNLSLRVLGARKDGYHDIDSLMVKLPGLADSLEFQPAGRFSFSCDDPALPTGDGNLVVKAAKAFAAAAGVKPGCSIRLTKRIPHSAGLGGGSSDAATTLQGLNQLHDNPLSAEKLSEIAAGIGSDVPFFLCDSRAARCTGRGEQVEPAEAPSGLPLLLLKSEFGVETAAVYGKCLSAEPISGIPYGPQQVDGLTLVNDLERAVFRKFMILGEMKNWLLQREEVAAALLCGAGSTLFAILHAAADTPALATTVRQEVDPKIWSWSGEL